MKEKFRVLAYYLFTDVGDAEMEVLRHQAFCRERDIRGRVYISEEGINGQMSASNDDAIAYMGWLKSQPSFQEVEFKADFYPEHVFEKLTVKYRKQLVALDEKVDLSKTAQYLEPDEWSDMLTNDREHVLIDVRNDYEWEVGRFENSETPACKTFREFKEYAEKLKNRIDPRNTPIMMCCTGGIRCEVYSAYLREKGFEKIYQLKGGIINYGHKMGSKHWLGKLFVFDDRMTVPISNEESKVIGKCHFCQSPADTYYNCANMDCNHLFIACAPCLKKYCGCCKEKCTKAPRLRTLDQQNPHKPFRKWYRYFKGKVQNANS